MIPQHLTLKNFLSYRELALNFQGLHTACICGPNGAGKSSLLEAMTWVLWGQSRVAGEDNIIHVGAVEAKVDFVFRSHQQVYRVVRTRFRGQGTNLEFQVAPAQGGRGSHASAFRTLTGRGIRATQQLIHQHIKLDYETFVNSAYLRQGRADEFMLKRPSERKQILADLLKLNRYDELAERARDRARQFKGQIELLQQSTAGLESQLQQRAILAQEQAILEAQLAQQRQQQDADQRQLKHLQSRQQERQTWQQQLDWQQQQAQTIREDCDRLRQELEVSCQQQQGLEALLHQEPEIIKGYRYWQQLQAQEEELAAKFQAHQTAQEQQQQLQRQQTEDLQAVNNQLQRTQTQQAALERQQEELQQILKKGADVKSALEQFRQARARLAALDQLQTQVSPLLQHRQHLQRERDRAQTRLNARLEELQTSAQQLQAQQIRQPRLQQAVLDVAVKLEHLEARRSYREQLREKGLERRGFVERLQEQQRQHQMQLAALEHKLQLLQEPSAACPLCDRPLDEHHWQLVLEKHREQQQDLLRQIWVIREQLVVSEREIQVFREEYRQLNQELGQYEKALEQRGQLQEQLHTAADGQQALQRLAAEVEHLNTALVTNDYAPELQAELQELDRTLAALNYDERDHALARGEVDRWRWAEIKQAELKQAQRRQRQNATQIAELQVQIEALQQQLEAAQDSPRQRQINRLDQHLAALGYNLEHHNALRVALRQAQGWQLRHQELQQARQQYPLVQQRNRDLRQRLQERSHALQRTTTQCDRLSQQLAQNPDCSLPIQNLEQQLQQRRQQLDNQLAHLGRLQQQQQYLEQLQSQLEEQQAQLQTAQYQGRIYQELAQAFGRNGIQALMIENVLPQLEAETNRILSRLSANQLHVQFVTQRASRRSSARQSKLIETLDILIADAQGTRPYETYSGGEAFRINFSIRLALARLLAQRSGTSLQLLIVDEGFGTQDREGCDRLVAAINAIASDFACILAITHIPHLKEAFQTRIEVSKTPDGSQVLVSE